MFEIGLDGFWPFMLFLFSFPEPKSAMDFARGPLLPHTSSFSLLPLYASRLTSYPLVWFRLVRVREEPLFRRRRLRFFFLHFLEKSVGILPDFFFRRLGLRCR
jgi:hypothetical protein